MSRSTTPASSKKNTSGPRSGDILRVSPTYDHGVEMTARELIEALEALPEHHKDSIVFIENNIGASAVCAVAPHGVGLVCIQTCGLHWRGMHGA